MNIPGIGPVTKDDDFDWYYSEQIAVPVLGGCACRFVVAAYGGDLKKEDFHIAIRNFLAADESVLREAEPYIYQYYESCKQYFDSEDIRRQWMRGYQGHPRCLEICPTW